MAGGGWDGEGAVTRGRPEGAGRGALGVVLCRTGCAGAWGHLCLPWARGGKAVGFTVERVLAGPISALGGSLWSEPVCRYL